MRSALAAQRQDAYPDGTSLRLLQWRHFAPRNDEWFDAWMQAWGEANNVAITVDHVSLAEMPSSPGPSIGAGGGYNIYELPITAGSGSWNDLLEAGANIYQATGIPVGIGLRPEPDSEMAVRSVIWLWRGCSRRRRECRAQQRSDYRRGGIPRGTASANDDRRGLRLGTAQQQSGADCR